MGRKKKRKKEENIPCGPQVQEQIWDIKLKLLLPRYTTNDDLSNYKKGNLGAKTRVDSWGSLFSKLFLFLAFSPIANSILKSLYIHFCIAGWDKHLWVTEKYSPYSRLLPKHSMDIGQVSNHINTCISWLALFF